jgi:hypothetical protein
MFLYAERKFSFNKRQIYCHTQNLIAGNFIVLKYSKKIPPTFILHTSIKMFIFVTFFILTFKQIF